MRTYQENIERCWQFYDSDFYHELQETHPSFIKSIFETICIDADKHDGELYRQLSDKYQLKLMRGRYLVDEVNGESIKLSADIICGRKQLVALRDNEFTRWIVDYETIRKQLDCHFVWPKHKLPTINTQRYQVYKDRIDYLLYDLKQYFQGADTPMKLAYENETTPLWLSQFKDFPDFIDKMKLKIFVDEAYNVRDLSYNNGKIIDGYITREELTESIPSYLENMLRLFQDN